MSEILDFRYEMRSEFDRPIERHSFKLMCLPPDTPRQRALELDCDISPCGWRAWGADGFGNRYVYGCAPEAHRSFSVRVRGRVEAGLAACEPDAGFVEPFLQSTPLTAPGAAAVRYFNANRAPAGLDSLAVAVYYMDRLHRDVAYQSGVSDTLTASEAVFARRAGVCQDFAHALITLCRMEGIPARYVAGMVPGEGETHAWVEVHASGAWHALDPTHDRPMGSCIQLARGRDCRDCLVNRGVYFNPAAETQIIRVNVSVKA